MVFSWKLKQTRTLGRFPVTITLNDSFVEDGLAECICSTLEEKVPCFFSGQRSALFGISEGCFLRAKGWAYRKVTYDEWRAKEFEHAIPRSFGETLPLEVKKRTLSRPLPERFLGGSGHYIARHVDEKGKPYKKISEARPHGAMRLERAKHERKMAEKIRSKESVLTDLPAGHFSFDDFPFTHRGVPIPCGGYLCLSRTPYDIRSLEFLAYCGNSELLKKLALPNRDFLSSIRDTGCAMGRALRQLHDAHITHFCPHPDNFKIIPHYPHHVSVDDLDNASENTHPAQWLGRMVLDIQTLFNFGTFMALPRATYDLPKPSCVDFDNHRKYSTLLREVRNQMQSTMFQNGSSAKGALYASLYQGYFGGDAPFVSPITLMTTPRKWFESGKSITCVDNEFLDLLRSTHHLK